ncbi:MAG: ImuA family protein [Caulobacteraceae bacterium]
MSREERLQAARIQIAAVESAPARNAGGKVLPFGDGRIDSQLAGGGLRLGRWHQAGSEGREAETAAAAAAFFALAALPLANLGAMVWIMRRGDLYAPGLAGLGFPAERLIQVEAGAQGVLSALEDALSSSGVAAAFGETDEISLLSGRRLQLACEKSGATGFVIRRRPFGGPLALTSSAAESRWTIAPWPSFPAAGNLGLGEPRWRVVLERSRGGGSGTWIMEKSHGAHPLRVVDELAGRGLSAPPSLRLAG